MPGPTETTASAAAPVKAEDATRALSGGGHDCGARDGSYPRNNRVIGRRSASLIRVAEWIVQSTRDRETGALCPPHQYGGVFVVSLDSLRRQPAVLLMMDNDNARSDWLDLRMDSNR